MSPKQDTQDNELVRDGVDKYFPTSLTTEGSIDIKAVPPEILSRIFILMANSYPGPDMTDPLDCFHHDETIFRPPRNDERACAVEEVRRLAIVCRTWRDIINGTPQLWTTFRFLFATRKEAEAKWSNPKAHPNSNDFLLLSTHRFQLSRERSKTLLLDWSLDVSLMPSADQFMSLWNRFVRPIMPRLASLAILGRLIYRSDIDGPDLVQMHSIWGPSSRTTPC
jgi:hypothetical protein